MKDARFAPYTSPASSSSSSASSSSSSASSSSAPAFSAASTGATPSDQSSQSSGPSQTIVHRVLRVMLASDPRPRGWEQVGQQGRGACLSVGCYNLLSKELALRGRRFHKNVHVPNPLQWQSRRALLLTEIETLEVDVLCVQELDASDHSGEFGISMGRLGYKSVFQKRHADHAHGFAIFFKKDRVALVDEYSVPCPDKIIVHGVDYAGLLVVLDVADGDEMRRVCVATTHIVCNDIKGFKKLGQIMTMISAAKVVMRRDPSIPLVFTGDMNAMAGSLLMEYIAKGSVDLSTMPEEDFSRESLSRPSSMVSQQHRDMVKVFKQETGELRDLVPTGSFALPRAKSARTRSLDQRDLAAPVASAFAPKAEELRHMIKIHRDLEDDVVAHPLHLTSVYDVPNIPDFIFHGEIMGCSPRLELVARLVLPSMLLQLKSGLPAAHLGSDHLAIGAKYRFLD